MLVVCAYFVSPFLDFLGSFCRLFSSYLAVQGLEKGIDYKKVLKAFKKDFCCNGTVVEDTELGQVCVQACTKGFVHHLCQAPYIS